MRTVLAVLAISLVPALAAAQPTKQAPAENPQAASATQIAVQEGIRRITSRDYDRAIEGLREASEAAANEADPHYYIGAALRAKGELEDALGSFRSALRLAQRGDDPLTQARCLQAVAETLERIALVPNQGQGGAFVRPNQLTEARAAWTEVLTFAQSHQDTISPAVPRARVEAIDRVLEQEEVYATVRRRIADREEELRNQQRGRQRGGR
jgi:tetratricopeptide (TPR) repeat protein